MSLVSPVSSPTAAFRVGHGYDLHRLEPVVGGTARPMILAGVPVPDSPVGPVGHSDGDAVYHAVTDAILGALAQPDIGQLFPDTAAENDNRDSAEFLDEAVRRMAAAGYAIGNMDITVICERPKISPLKDAMLANLIERLHCDSTQVNLKGKTHEQVDAVGEGRAIEVHVVVLLMR